MDEINGRGTYERHGGMLRAVHWHVGICESESASLMINVGCIRLLRSYSKPELV